MYGLHSWGSHFRAGENVNVLSVWLTTYPDLPLAACERTTCIGLPFKTDVCLAATAEYVLGKEFINTSSAFLPPGKTHLICFFSDLLGGSSPFVSSREKRLNSPCQSLGLRIASGEVGQDSPATQSHCRQGSSPLYVVLSGITNAFRTFFFFKSEPEFLKGIIHVFFYAWSIAQHTETVQ